MILVPEFPYIKYKGKMVPVACGDGVANRSCPADEEQNLQKFLFSFFPADRPVDAGVEAGQEDDREQP